MCLVLFLCVCLLCTANLSFGGDLCGCVFMCVCIDMQLFTKPKLRYKTDKKNACYVVSILCIFCAIVRFCGYCSYILILYIHIHICIYIYIYPHTYINMMNISQNNGFFWNRGVYTVLNL